MGLFGDVVDAVGDAAGDVVDAVEDAVEDAVDAVEDAAEAVADVAEDAVDALADVAEDALDALGELVEDALDAAGDVYDAFAALAEEAWNGATDIVEDGWNALANAAEDAWQAIEQATEEAWDAIADAAEDAWENITAAVEDIWEGVQSAVETAVEAAAAAVEHMADAAASAYEHAVDAIEKTLTWLGDLIKDVAHAIAMLGACLAGIIIHNLAEADNILTNFWKAPKKLTPFMQGEAAPFLPGVPVDKAYYIENANLSANHFGKNADAMTFSAVEIAGINFAYMIYMDDVFDETQKNDRALMVHELVHVGQYKKFGFEDAFACAYGVGFADAGLSYEKNPLESEAFSVQNVYLTTP